MIVSDLRSIVATAPADELPSIVAELEACKALAWVRLCSEAANRPLGAGNGAPNATAEAVAELFNVPVSQVYEQARQGRLPCVRLGKYVRFNLDAVRAALAQPQGSVSPSLGTRKKPSKTEGNSRPATTLQPDVGAST